MWPYTEHETDWLDTAGRPPGHDSGDPLDIYIRKGRRLQAQAMADAFASAHRAVRRSAATGAENAARWIAGSLWQRSN